MTRCRYSLGSVALTGRAPIVGTDECWLKVHTPMEASCAIAWPSLFLSFGVQLDCSADYLLEGRFIDLVALMQIDCAPRVALQAGIEDALWVFDGSALQESELYESLVGLACADDPVVRPDWNSPPFPFLRYPGVCVFDELADAGERLATPVA